jgi:phospholipid transport system substrate-binding protein
MIKRPLLVATVAATTLFFAATHTYANPANDASHYIEDIAKKALAAISNAKASKTQKQASLDKLFKDNVDIPWIGRFVMGRFWKQATDAQKASYLKEYEKFLIQHYTSRFTDYTSGSFTIAGVKDDGEGEFTVNMELKGDKKNDPPVLVDYRVRKQGSGFKIFDVIVEGVSLITTQRSEFSSVISQNDIDYLIAQLKNKSMPTNDGKK